MKKVKILGLIMVMVLGVTACGSKEEVAPVEPVETPVVEEAVIEEEVAVIEEEEPVAEEEPVEREGTMFEEAKWFVGTPTGPEPTVEEKAVLEAELKEEVLANMDKVERVVIDWLDIVTSSDKEYTSEERIKDLIEKKVVVSEWSTGEFGYTAEYFMEYYEEILSYKIDRLEYREEELLFNDSEYFYELRRNVVPFYLELSIEYKEDGEIKTDEFDWIIYGPFRGGDFRGWNYMANQE